MSLGIFRSSLSYVHDIPSPTQLDRFKYASVRERVVRDSQEVGRLPSWHMVRMLISMVIEKDKNRLNTEGRTPNHRGRVALI